MTLATTDTPATPVERDIRLSVSAPGGLPLTMAGYILRALGTAYPGCVIDTTGRDGFSGYSTVLSLRIPYADYVDSDGMTEADFAELAPDKDEPGLLAFTNGIRDGSFGMSPPPWLSTMLLSVAESIHDTLDDAGATNYLAFEIIPQDGGEPFTWIVCRRGAPSPHALRTRAENRIALLEQQLRDAGIEPADSAEPDGQ